MNSIGDIRCPYQGLAPYAEEDGDRFFGRHAEIRVVSANLLAARLTLLYGDSGVGKSSLLRAGVVPHLQRLAQTGMHRLGRPRFHVAVVERWQDDPIATIRERLVATLGAAAGDPPIPPCEPGGFTEYLAAWTDRLGGLLLLVFDQFEEYLRYHERESGETSFAEEFPRAVTRPDLNVNFLLAVREDEYGRLDRFKPKLPGLYRNYLRLRYLGLAAAREAILRPLDAWAQRHPEGALPQRIEPALVDAILEDVRSGRVVLGEAGVGAARQAEEDVQIQTPYLQLVLTRVWRVEAEAGSTELRLATYRKLGGADRIVRSHLDEAVGALTRDEQALAAGVFRHLVTPSGAKVAHSLADLADYAGAEMSQLAVVLDHLCGSTRVLRRVSPAPGQANVPRFEIYTDSLAKPVLDWGNRFRRAQERAEAEARLAVERRRKQIFRRLSVGLGLALVIAVTLGALAWLKMREAKVWELISRADLLLNQDPRNSLALMVEAANWMWLQPTTNKVAAERMLRAALLASHERPAPGDPPTGLVRSNAWEWTSPDGKLRFRRRAEEKSVLEMERPSSGTASPGPPEHFDSQLGGEVLAVEFNATGSLFAVCGEGGVKVWRRESAEQGTGRPISSLPCANTVVRAAAFHPNNAFLATVDDDGTIRLWSPFSGSLLKVFGQHSGSINTVAVSPDGRFLATGHADRSAVVWDIWNQRPVATMRGHTAAVTRVQFSVDGQFLWTCDGDGSTRYWASRTGLIVAQTPSLTGIVAAAPISTGVLYVGDDSFGSIWLLEPSSAKPTRELTQVGFKVTKVAFSADGERVALAGEGDRAKQAEIRNLKLASQPPVRLAASNRITGMSFSRDAELLATVDEEGETLVWRWRERSHGSVLLSSPAQDGCVLFSNGSAGRLVVASGNDPLVFALDGQVLAGTGATNPVVAFTNRHEGIVKQLALSPDGTRVLSVGLGRSPWVWRLADGQSEGHVPLKDQQDALLSGAFSPDGRFLLTGGEKGVACVWDFQQATPLLELPLPGHQEPDRGELRGPGDVCAVWFSADGRQAFTAGREGTIRRHDTSELLPYPALLELAHERLRAGP